MRCGWIANIPPAFIQTNTSSTQAWTFYLHGRVRVVRPFVNVCVALHVFSFLSPVRTIQSGALPFIPNTEPMRMIRNDSERFVASPKLSDSESVSY